MPLRRYALLLAATAPLVACGTQPPPAAPDNTIEVASDVAVGNAAGNVSIPVTPVEPTGTGIAATPSAKDSAAAENATAPARPEAKVEADYLGKWIGPEGLVLDVKRKPGGGVTIVNQWSLDDKGTFDGSVTAEGLRFMRKGEAVTASPGNGDATDMKWLAGKKNCLIVKPGEGYCRG